MGSRGGHLRFWFHLKQEACPPSLFIMTLWIRFQIFLFVPRKYAVTSRLVLVFSVQSQRLIALLSIPAVQDRSQDWLNQSHRQTGRQKVMHMSPYHISTSGLIKIVKWMFDCSKSYPLKVSCPGSENVKAVFFMWALGSHPLTQKRSIRLGSTLIPTFVATLCGQTNKLGLNT